MASRAPVRIPPAPEGLTPASAELWPGLVTDLAAVSQGHAAALDLVTLGDLLRVRDRLAAVAVRLAEDGVVTEGSTGQTQRHPLIEVEAKLRGEWLAGVRALGLSNRYGVAVTAAGRLKAL